MILNYLSNIMSLLILPFKSIFLPCTPSQNFPPTEWIPNLSQKFDFSNLFDPSQITSSDDKRTVFNFHRNQREQHQARDMARDVADRERKKRVDSPVKSRKSFNNQTKQRRPNSPRTQQYHSRDDSFSREGKLYCNYLSIMYLKSS